MTSLSICPVVCFQSTIPSLAYKKVLSSPYLIIRISYRYELIS